MEDQEIEELLGSMVTIRTLPAYYAASHAVTLCDLALPLLKSVECLVLKRVKPCPE